MDLTNQRRSTNIEDERTGALGELVNRLVAPPYSALHGLMNHPFMTRQEYNAMLYEQSLKRDPPEFGKLSKELGEEQIVGSGKRPIPYHPQGFDESATPTWWKVLTGL